jgi:hypothetical protein
LRANGPSCGGACLVEGLGNKQEFDKNMTSPSFVIGCGHIEQKQGL